ncbi:MAG: hypothetical protein QXT77_07790 [Candidatus Methanomethylicaceae archaeon]
MRILANPVAWILKFHAVSIVPALIGAGAAIIGGALSDRSNRKAAAATNETQEQLHRENIALQREFAQAGIRWKVEDAKAAGLHPLYAIGAAPATFSPSIPAMVTPDRSGLGRGLAEAGQHLGRAVSAQQTPDQRAITQATLAHLVAQTQKEEAMAMYYASEAARNRQNAFTSSGLPEATVEVGPLVKTVPDEVISHDPRDPSRTAGVHPGTTTYTMPGGIKLRLPSEQMKESIEDIPTLAWPFIFAESAKEDPNFWRKVDDYYFGGRSQKFMSSTEREWRAIIDFVRKFNKKLPQPPLRGIIK